jgi:3-hydroxymyristoyl/3-hydroxydecanoyl-(acyl carrier protein) dehydratase
VLQVEALAQLGGIIMIDPADAAQQNNFFFGGVDNCRWRKPVVPGDVLVRQGARGLLLGVVTGWLPCPSLPCAAPCYCR